MIKKLLNTIKSPSDLRRLTMEQLEELAEEIRHLLKVSVSRNGGHLASNLGVVELTIALHYVFDFSRDRLVWDVGHQCYVHKVLTGRALQFARLRQLGGVSGFPNPQESEYDQFAVGHAGTAIATAVGLALGAQKQKTEEKVVALVGDASIVNGLSFEGLNNTSLVNRQLLIILNDNSMAIDKTEGAFAQYLTRVRVSRHYEELQLRTKRMLKKLPYGDAIHDALDRIKGGIKTTLLGRQKFEQLGIPIYGPVDGHDIGSLIKLFTLLKEVDHPLVFHVHTEKGRGFAPAREDPRAFHSTKPFVVDGETASFSDSTDRSFTAAFSHTLADLMESDPRIMTLTAAMPGGTGLAELRGAFPDRVIDVGIAESAAVDIAAGLARCGLKPIVVIYSTFIQRAFDQIFQEVALQNLPVVFCLDRAGLVGGDGATHHGFCDIALLRPLPNMVMMAPMDQPELTEALKFSLQLNQPSVIRYPRDLVPPPNEMPFNYRTAPFQQGQAVWLRQGTDAVIVAYGRVAHDSYIAAETLATEGFNVGVISARFAKPLDKKLLRDILSPENPMPILTIEDHALIGGFGSAIIEFAQEHNLDARNIVRLGIPDRFIEHNTRMDQLADLDISPQRIAHLIREKLRPGNSDPKNQTGDNFYHNRRKNLKK